MALFLLESKTVVRELIVATGNDRDTIHELLLVCHLMSCSTPRTVVSTTRERGINADNKGVDLDVRLRGRRQAVSGFVSTVSPARRAAFTAPALLASLPFFFVMHDCCRAVLNSSCREVPLFSSVVCVKSRAIVTNSFTSVTLRRVNARNTAHLISVTSAFSSAFASMTWVRAACLCDSAAVSSLPKGVTNVAFSSIS